MTALLVVALAVAVFCLGYSFGQEVEERRNTAMSEPAYRLRERGSWRWADGDSWVDYPSVQEAVDALYRHGGGQVRGWLAATEGAPSRAEKLDAITRQNLDEEYL